LAIANADARRRTFISIAVDHSNSIEASSSISDGRSIDAFNSDELVSEKRSIIQVKGGESYVFCVDIPPVIGDIEQLERSICTY
jgi:hypothetical protein